MLGSSLSTNTPSQKKLRWWKHSVRKQSPDSLAPLTPSCSYPPHNQVGLRGERRHQLTVAQKPHPSLCWLLLPWGWHLPDAKKTNPPLLCCSLSPPLTLLQVAALPENWWAGWHPFSTPCCCCCCAVRSHCLSPQCRSLPSQF